MRGERSGTGGGSADQVVDVTWCSRVGRLEGWFERVERSAAPQGMSLRGLCYARGQLKTVEGAAGLWRL